MNDPDAGPFVGNDRSIVVEPQENTSRGSTVAATVLPIK
jgi:hypothetical protein